jgi:ankyrin repeat protein
VKRCVEREQAALKGRHKNKNEQQTQLRAFINRPTATGKTALAQACLYGQLETARYLLEQGANAQQMAKNAFDLLYSPLHFACFFERDNTADLIALLLNDKADTRAKASMAAERLRTPLHTAAIFNNASAIQALLVYGAKLDQKTDDTGNTPLQDAAMKGHLACFKLLLENGPLSLLVARNNNQETPFMTALVFNQPHVAQYLFEEGFWLKQADINKLLSDPIVCKTLPHVQKILENLIQQASQQLRKAAIMDGLDENKGLSSSSVLTHSTYFKRGKTETSPIAVPNIQENKKAPLLSRSY